MPKRPDQLLESQELAKYSKIYLDGVKQGLRLKNALSCHQYVIFFYKYVLEYSIPVIADITRLKESTVRTHHRRAIEKIRKLSKNL